MDRIQWTDEMSVGIELIDDQHKQLIQHLSDFATAIESHHVAARIGSTLDFLIKYTGFHFSSEEKHMAVNDYPGLENQVTQHNQFRATLSNLEEDFKEEGATYILADSIDTLLVNWLIKHICGMDVAFGTFLRKKGIVLTEEG